MCNEHAEFQNYVQLQREMFDSAKNRGWPPSRIAKKAKLPPSTVAGWAAGTAMPAWAFSLLCRFIPDDISSIMMEPSDKHIVPVDGEESLLDDLCCEAAELATDYARARHPKSPGGVAIVHTEKAPIKKRARRIAALGSAVAND